MNVRKRHRAWVLLYRKEGRQHVYLYEPLRKKQLVAMLRHGWAIEMRG